MKRFFVSVIAIMMIIALAACGSKDSSGLSDTTDPTQIDGQNNGKNSNGAIVSIDYAGEELLAQTNAFDEFIDDDSEYQVKVVFAANTAVKDFKYFEISFIDVDGSGNMDFDIVEELYSIDELSPERPLVIGMDFAGTVPNRGISYMDENGTTRYYDISMSGEDGSLLLNEFS